MSPPSPALLRVNKALGLLPALEATTPLRALLMSISEPDDQTAWSSSAPYLTVGMRTLQPEELRKRMPETLRRITDHIRAIYDAYLDGLEAEERGDRSAVAMHLLKAGRVEERAGRLAQATRWYEAARQVSETLKDRHPEMESLGALGGVALAVGKSAEGARVYQRALALAEAEFDQAQAVAACEGLGDAAASQAEWTGGRAWYVRGLQLAEASNDRRSLGRLERKLGTLAWRQGDLMGAAEHLNRAHDLAEAIGAADEISHVLRTQGRLAAVAGRKTSASAAYREALTWAQRVPEDPSVELVIRLGLAELHLETAHLLEAEAELRRAEQLAIAGNLTRRLAQVYTLMGKLRGCEGDETGFVFFEQAIQLSNWLEHSPPTQGEVYLEYGLFRERLGHTDEARGCLERARELFALSADALARHRVQTELERLLG